jgi:hypothetical protein
MKLSTSGEYYLWYCDWCDSRNLTPWSKAGAGKVNCGGCHKEHNVNDTAASDAGRQAQSRQSLTLNQAGG